MLHGLLFAALAFAGSPTGEGFQSRNGEFIFSKYPPRALAAGEQGAVRFRAEVDEKGNVLGCEVTAGSGHPRLDKETCELIVNHATFAPTLDSTGKARAAVHDGLVNWRIPGSPAATPAKAKIASAAPDKVICKRIEKTGSLVAHSRLCLTQRDWTRYADETQDEWGALQGRKGTTNGN